IHINEVVFGTAFGILMGPYVAGIFDPRSWGSAENIITLEFMRVALGVGLFCIGVDLPSKYMKNYAKSLLIMVVPTMAFGWVVVATIIYGLFPSLSFVSALCIASCFTPTDPVTCAAITRGTFARRYDDIPDLLSAESASNDGLAYPFLSISIYLIVESSAAVAIGKWFLVGWLYQVILGTVLGAILGFIFSKLMKLSYGKKLNDSESYLAQFLALSILAIGIASTIGADDLLAAFAAGTFFLLDQNFKDRTKDAKFSSVIDYVLNCACFIYIGAWLPFSAYESPAFGISPVRLLVLFLAILVLRRIPFLLLVYSFIKEINTWQDALFAGHFGKRMRRHDMGVSALFVSALARTHLPTPQNPPANQAELLAETIQIFVSFVVLGSIVVHGLSVPVLSLWQGVNSRKPKSIHPQSSRESGNDCPDVELAILDAVSNPQVRSRSQP
ncbi:Cation/H+ exchanger, partial [Hygrophoropsis aurantiaca]